MKQVIWNILNKLKLASIIQLFLKSGLKDDGWFKSYQTKQAVNKNGEPIPWCTYSFIKFIDTRLNKNFDVFEYGCGNSTLWFADRVNGITSVEHDSDWFKLISKKMPANAKVIYKELIYDGEYSKSVFNENKKYHIIIVDGRDRANCVKNATNALTDDGIIIFDNSQLPQYQAILNDLMKNNFRKIDFIGSTPVIAHENTTTIFYRSNNCLGV